MSVQFYTWETEVKVEAFRDTTNLTEVEVKAFRDATNLTEVEMEKFPDATNPKTNRSLMKKKGDGLIRAVKNVVAC